MQPSNQPSAKPSARPTRAPLKRGQKRTFRPTTTPSSIPAAIPTAQPTSLPTYTSFTKWEHILHTTIGNMSAGLDTSESFTELRVPGSLKKPLGSCESWQGFLGSLNFRSFFEKPYIIKVQSVDDLTKSFAQCTNSSNVTTFLTALTTPLQLSDASTTLPHQARHFMCNKRRWAVCQYRSDLSRSNSFCVDCKNPCRAVDSAVNLNFSPCNSSVNGDSYFSAHFKLLTVGLRQIARPPDIVSIATISARTDISVNVTLSEGSGLVQCAAVLGADANITVNFLKSTGVYNSTVPGTNTSIVQMSNLSPQSTYSVYCLTISREGNIMTLSDVLKTKKIVKTKCCKTIFLHVLVSVIEQGQSASKAVKLSLNAAPTQPLTVRLFGLCIGPEPSRTKFNLTFIPNVFTVQPSSLVGEASPLYSTVLAPSHSGVCSIVLRPPDLSQIGYSISNPSGSEILVKAVDSIPRSPRINAVQFSSDGSSVVLTFDVPTNRGRSTTLQSSLFPCKAILSCQGCESALCHFSDDLHLVVDFSSASASSTKKLVEVNDPIYLKPGNSIRSLCLPVSSDGFVRTTESCNR